MLIKTEHLIIRNFQKKDAEGLLEYLSHPRALLVTACIPRNQR